MTPANIPPMFHVEQNPTQVKTSPLEVPITEPAKEIRKLHDQIVAVGRKTLGLALRIGELLTEERNKKTHGQWLPWLKENIPFSDRTAQNYLRLWGNRELLKNERISDLAGAYKLLEQGKIKKKTVDKFPPKKPAPVDIQFVDGPKSPPASSAHAPSSPPAIEDPPRIKTADEERAVAQISSPRPPEVKRRPIGKFNALIAIDYLAKIPPKDEERAEACRMVRAWLDEWEVRI